MIHNSMSQEAGGGKSRFHYPIPHNISVPFPGTRHPRNRLARLTKNYVSHSRVTRDSPPPSIYSTHTNPLKSLQPNPLKSLPHVPIRCPNDTPPLPY